MKNTFRYDDICALKYFVNAIRVYPHKKIDESFFTPFTRCDRDERFVYDLVDKLAPNNDVIRTKRKYRSPCYDILQDLWHTPGCREEVRSRLVARAKRLLRTLESEMGEPIEKTRLDKIAKFVNLNSDERKILDVCWLCTTGRINEGMGLPYGGEKYEYFAMLTGLDEMTVRGILAFNGKLRRFGIVNMEKNSELTEAASCFMGGVVDNLSSAFYKEDSEEALPAEYFAETGEKHLPILRSMLKGRNGKGVNIVLYGASGTGKTSFVRRLAKDTGRRLLTVVQSKIKDGEYEAVKSHDRCTALRVCAEHADVKTDLILVDEADKLLGDWDKGSLNVLLEQTTVPVVWVANIDASSIDRSVRRRFDYSVCFEPFDCEGRVRVWKNALAHAKMKLPEASVKKLAEKYAVNAGVVAKALENSRKVRGSKVKTLERLLDQAMELSGGAVQADSEKCAKPAQDYSLDGLNIEGDIPLTDIVECVRNFCGGEFSAPDAPRMNILLSGAPGTGKTEFVKYLAKEVKRPLEIVSGSRLLSMFVGGTEKNIASAFRRAKTNNAILFLDEIDSFLQDRKGADHQWEVTQVNELLQQMEMFGGVMIGATNFAENLDRAVLRRFTFKLKFDYLDRSGRREFFGRFFKMEADGEAGERLGELDNLTPGDFRTVRQSLYYLGGKRTALDYIAALERESDAKRAGEGKRIGFAVS